MLEGTVLWVHQSQSSLGFIHAVPATFICSTFENTHWWVISWWCELCGSFLRSVRDSGSLPSPEYWFVLVSGKCPYQEQTQRFVYPKFPLIPVKGLAAQVRQRQSPGSASQITKAVRDTTVLIKLVLKAKAREWERRWKLSRSGSLSIANLLLIRAALMRNKESQEKTPKAQDCTIFRWIKTNPWQWHLKTYFILVKSCLCLDTCTHPPVANEDLWSGSKTWVTHLCVCVSVYQR